MSPDNAGRATLYIVAPGSRLAATLAPGSAVVGSPRNDAIVCIDYEGNLYGAANLQRFEERAMHAAGRHFSRYPTVARMGLPLTEVAQNLIALGSIDRAGHIDYDHPQAGELVAAAQEAYLARGDRLSRRAPQP